MMDSYFPWSKVSQSLSETFRALPVALSVDLQKIESLYYSNDQLTPKVVFPQKLQLQLREGYVGVVGGEGKDIIDFFESEPSVFILIREISGQVKPENTQSNKINLVQCLIKITHQTQQNESITFYCQLERQKLIELYRIFARTYSIHLDFHTQFRPLRKIGHGLTSTVYQAMRLIDQSYVAVKAFKKSAYFAMAGGKGKRAFLKEFKILSECDHQNVCRFEGVYETENTIYIIQQFYQKSLSTFVLTQGLIPRKMVLGIMQDLLRGVSYMHQKGIFHRDIKLQNIMLRKQHNSYKAVLIDLGLAEYKDTEDFLFEKCGTPGYVAPEVFRHGAKNLKCDVFSLGVIFYILLFKTPVFQGETKEQVLQNNKKGVMTLDMERVNGEEQLIRDMVLRMLDVNEEKRISCREALLHPLFFCKGPLSPQTEMSMGESYLQEEVGFEKAS